MFTFSWITRALVARINNICFLTVTNFLQINNWNNKAIMLITKKKIKKWNTERKTTARVKSLTFHIYTHCCHLKCSAKRNFALIHSLSYCKIFFDVSIVWLWLTLRESFTNYAKKKLISYFLSLYLRISHLSNIQKHI